MTDLTLDKILEAKRKLDNQMADNRFLSNPFSFAGLPIYTTPEIPKLKLRKHVAVSEAFRREFDTWLIARFGYKDPLMERNTTYLIAGMGLVMRPEMASLIRATCV